jgi:hypothetical protein
MSVVDAMCFQIEPERCVFIDRDADDKTTLPFHDSRRYRKIKTNVCADTSGYLQVAFSLLYQ